MPRLSLICLPYMSASCSYVQGLEAAVDDVQALGEHRRKLRAILDTQVRDVYSLYVSLYACVYTAYMRRCMMYSIYMSLYAY